MLGKLVLVGKNISQELDNRELHQTDLQKETETSEEVTTCIKFPLLDIKRRNSEAHMYTLPMLWACSVRF
jgi:hypothetical protein